MNKKIAYEITKAAVSIGMSVLFAVTASEPVKKAFNLTKKEPEAIPATDIEEEELKDDSEA